MNPKSIPPLDAHELGAVAQTLEERYGEPVPLEEVEVELRLNPARPELTPCPGVYWERDGCHFVLCKVGRHRYHGQFYYRGHQQYGTSIREYDDLLEALVALLRAQADHVLEQNA